MIIFETFESAFRVTVSSTLCNTRNFFLIDLHIDPDGKIGAGGPNFWCWCIESDSGVYYLS